MGFDGVVNYNLPIVGSFHENDVTVHPLGLRKAGRFSGGHKTSEWQVLCKREIYIMLQHNHITMIIT